MSENFIFPTLINPPVSGVNTLQPPNFSQAGTVPPGYIIPNYTQSANFFPNNLVPPHGSTVGPQPNYFANPSQFNIPNTFTGAQSNNFVNTGTGGPQFLQPPQPNYVNYPQQPMHNAYGNFNHQFGQPTT